eukprot:GHVU01037581.1.p4 GENE.GHVU01037581.1~~GHVU01037581.1.p4  ORF type:complete len:116 (+),score=20.50 GHVU01037581.1:1348-1695(+)
MFPYAVFMVSPTEYISGVIAGLLFCWIKGVQVPEDPALYVGLQFVQPGEALPSELDHLDLDTRAAASRMHLLLHLQRHPDGRPLLPGELPDLSAAFETEDWRRNWASRLRPLEPH